MTQTTAITVPKWTRQQVDLIRQTVAKNLSEHEFMAFAYMCRRLGLDPILKQIYAIKFFDGEQNNYTVAYVVGIDGYRLIAQRTRELAGISEPMFTLDPEDSKKPIACTLTVYRFQDGEKIPYTATCRFNEYAQTVPDKQSGGRRLRANWERQPFNMLEKCTEAKALRKAFQQEMGPVRAEEELGVINVSLPDQDEQAAGQAVTGGNYEPGRLYLGEVKAITAGTAKKAPGRIVLRGDEQTVDTPALGFWMNQLPEALKQLERLEDATGRRAQFSISVAQSKGRTFYNLEHLAWEPDDRSPQKPPTESTGKSTEQSTDPVEEEAVMSECEQLLEQVGSADELQTTWAEIQREAFPKLSNRNRIFLKATYDDLKVRYR